MALVVLEEPVLANPAGRKLAMPVVSGWPAMLPLGMPRSLFAQRLRVADDAVVVRVVRVVGPHEDVPGRRLVIVPLGHREAGEQRRAVVEA